MFFACPKCLLPLEPADGGRSRRCGGGHSFDMSREGYFNLLLDNKGGIHGDNEIMVKARREFLSKGHYLKMAGRMVDAVLTHTPPLGAVLDMGCGEGYYTELIAHALSSRDGKCNLMALDISKDAVRRAAKRNTGAAFAVASAYSVPLYDSSVDTVINLFSPMADGEVRRILKQHGKFIYVYPGKWHLYELKEKIYDVPYTNVPDDSVPEGFRLVDEEQLCYDMSLCSSQEILSLFMMTPYAYRTNETGRGRVGELDTLTVRAHFHIRVLEKA